MNGRKAKEARAEAGEEGAGLGFGREGGGRVSGCDGRGNVWTCGDELEGGEEDVEPCEAGEGVVGEEVGCDERGLRCEGVSNGVRGA